MAANWPRGAADCNAAARMQSAPSSGLTTPMLPSDGGRRAGGGAMSPDRPSNGWGAELHITPHAGWASPARAPEMNPADMLLASVRREIDSLEDKVNRQQSRFQEQSARLVESVLQPLEGKVQALESERPTLSFQISEFGATVKALQQEIEQQSHRFDETEARSRKWRQVLEGEVRANYKELKRDVAELSELVRSSLYNSGAASHHRSAAGALGDAHSASSTMAMRNELFAVTESLREDLARLSAEHARSPMQADSDRSELASQSDLRELGRSLRQQVDGALADSLVEIRKELRSLGELPARFASVYAEVQDLIEEVSALKVRGAPHYERPLSERTDGDKLRGEAERQRAEVERQRTHVEEMQRAMAALEKRTAETAESLAELAARVRDMATLPPGKTTLMHEADTTGEEAAALAAEDLAASLRAARLANDVAAEAGFAIPQKEEVQATTVMIDLNGLHSDTPQELSSSVGVNGEIFEVRQEVAGVWHAVAELADIVAVGGASAIVSPRSGAGSPAALPAPPAGTQPFATTQLPSSQSQRLAHNEVQAALPAAAVAEMQRQAKALEDCQGLLRQLSEDAVQLRGQQHDAHLAVERSGDQLRQRMEGLQKEVGRAVEDAARADRVASAVQRQVEALSTKLDSSSSEVCHKASSPGAEEALKDAVETLQRSGTARYEEMREDASELRRGQQRLEARVRSLEELQEVSSELRRGQQRTEGRLATLEERSDAAAVMARRCLECEDTLKSHEQELSSFSDRISRCEDLANAVVDVRRELSGLATQWRDRAHAGEPASGAAKAFMEDAGQSSPRLFPPSTPGGSSLPAALSSKLNSPRVHLMPSPWGSSVYGGGGAAGPDASPQALATAPAMASALSRTDIDAMSCASESLSDVQLVPPEARRGGRPAGTPTGNMPSRIARSFGHIPPRVPVPPLQVPRRPSGDEDRLFPPSG
eukprot:TRINITY_DN31537_c0_g4_i1.p1 TRINITY_DN31537_c0_g4~~TRINITY_DN31537_c0_g4_i1.p1  ORF type:complete len:965 (-),score=241.54 TRINITY_DN31537_c0_g4_i1:818-3658(-)